MTITTTSSVGTLTLSIPYTQTKLNGIQWANAHSLPVVLTTTVSTLDYKGNV
jgi:hypothetical protein